ncbi:MAG: hypothetical protein K6F17_04380 [Lachnospiraceae bacterium]|nr:hypothetical protein [Lachnospiraceae bacterium]
MRSTIGRRVVSGLLAFGICFASSGVVSAQAKRISDYRGGNIGDITGNSRYNTSYIRTEYDLNLNQGGNYMSIDGGYVITSLFSNQYPVMDLGCKLDLHFEGMERSGYSAGVSLAGPMINTSFTYNYGTFSIEHRSYDDWDCEYCFGGDIIWGVKSNYGVYVASSASFVTPTGVYGSCVTNPKRFRQKMI